MSIYPLLLEAENISLLLLFSITLKIDKEHNKQSWESDNFGDSNLEKKTWINVRNRYKKMKQQLLLLQNWESFDCKESNRENILLVH